jgi:hypothetical protein
MVTEFKLLPQQYSQLTALTRTRDMPVEKVVQAAIVEWLDNQAQLERARKIRRALGRGLAESNSTGDIAQNHDHYLYGRPQSGVYRHVTSKSET